MQLDLSFSSKHAIALFLQYDTARLKPKNFGRSNIGLTLNAYIGAVCAYERSELHKP
jgi:hypothetical protein